jgi:RNA polymerase sigma-70 factor (ECF subfamily)
VGRPDPLPDERALVERAQKGDKRAFEKLYRAYARTIFSYVLVPMLGDRDDAEDCLREAFLSAHKALPNYEYRAGGIYPWLKTLAKNKARDLLRASGRRQRLRGAFQEHVESVGSRDPQNPAEEEIERQALRTQIEGVLEGMNARYARVLRLRLLEDRSREECAKLLEVKIGTLDVLLYRACRAFRAACEKQGIALGGAI